MCSLRKARTIRKQIQQIITQGNNKEIQNLFIDIVNACRSEFREDNESTLAAFLTENLYNAFVVKDPSIGNFIKPAMIDELNNIDSTKN